MNRKKLVVVGTAAVVAGAVTACGGGGMSQHPLPGGVSSTQSLDTQQVLSQAQTSSETSTPFAVNGGDLTLTDSSDSSGPIDVNAT